MNDKLQFTIIFSGMFIFFGIIAFIIGIALFIETKKKEKNCTSKTYGKITDIIEKENYHYDNLSKMHVTDINLFPVIEFNIGKLKFKKVYQYGGKKSEYEIGQDVEIYYNPENYKEYYIAGEDTPQTLSIVFTFFGIIFIFIAIFWIMLNT